MNGGLDESGTTVIIAGVKRQSEDGKFAAYLGNAGDSRGILLRLSRADEPKIVDLDEEKETGKIGVSRPVETYSEWEELVASSDHKPDEKVERMRIEKAGGYV